MSDQRKGGIAWTEETWNPIRGCTVVSAGCKNCYAMKMANRYSGPGMPYEGLTKVVNGKAVWTGEVRMIPEHLSDPLRWQRPRMIFVNSMSDLFHDALSDDQIITICAVMAMARRHTFQVLTKRSKRLRNLFNSADFQDRVHATWAMDAKGQDVWQWPLPNVWLGISAENQERADERIPDLLATPAAVRFVSAEPLIGRILFDNGSHSWLSCTSGVTEDDYEAMTPQQQEDFSSCCESFNDHGAHFQGIDWVIAGGESGPKARPCAVEWIRSIKDQCRAAGVPVFVKQLGAIPTTGDRFDSSDWPPGTAYRLDPTAARLQDTKGGDPSEWPEDLRVREMPR